MQRMSPGMRLALLAIGVLVLAGAVGYVFLSRGSGTSQGSKADQAQQEALAVARIGKPPIAVPNVVGEVLVNAKEDLDAAGLAWEVIGPVKAYHTNVVAKESPAAGTRVVDTGAPLVTLQLKRNPTQPESGV